MTQAKNNSRPKGQAASPKNLAATSAPVVILFGETGCGKSHFISVAGKPKLKPTPALGKPGNMESQTKSVAPFTVEKSMPNHSQATRAQLIDTPGFNETYEKDDDIVKHIVEWLRQEPDTTVAGVLYLHDTSQHKTPIYKEDIIREVPGTRYITWSSTIEKSADGGYPFEDTNDSAWNIITAAMKKSTPKGVPLTRGQLANKLEEISGQSPPRGSEENKGYFQRFQVQVSSWFSS